MKMFLWFGLTALLMAVSCTFTQKIKSGTEAFEVKQYALATQMLKEEYAEAGRNTDRARMAFMIGQSYEFMREPDMAIQWYNQAYEQGFGLVAREKQADMLRQTENYAGASTIYQELMATGSDVQRYRGLITLCNQAAQWKQDEASNPYKIRPATFNSPGSDYAPYLIGPDRLVFTSDRNNSTGNHLYNWSGRDFSDLYTVDLVSGIVQPFDHVLNTPDNEGTIAMTADRFEMYFTRCFPAGAYDSNCKLMMCRLRGASWSTPELLPFMRDGVNYGHPALAGKDSILIFSADDPTGSGGYDLYYTLRGPGGWGEPIAFSERINTIGNERFPAMHKDTLYFSSDGHPGLGGFDIFKSYTDPSGLWVPPLNLKAPINSGWDDFGFVVDTFQNPDATVLARGYFSSSRNTQTGDDIYAWEQHVPPPEPTEPDIVKPKPEDPTRYHIYLAIKVVEPVFATPGDPNSERIGKKPIPEVVLHITEGIAMRREVTDSKGLLIFELGWDRSYEFQAIKKGYLNQYRAFSTMDIKKDRSNPVTTYNMEIVLEPIFENTEIVLHDIFYDYDEWAIRDDARPSLDALAKILKENPNLRIQLSSHTDCRGEDDYNQDLSQKRAQSAVDYLVSQQIQSDRMTAVGYGESRLAVNCNCTDCTEDQHQQNRRTTFKILGNR
jgi:outer membrane protein OmpA-like peptidoglycan-associated protein